MDLYKYIYIEIYKVFKNNYVSFSKNSNAVFFYLNKLADNLIELIIN